MCKAAQQKFGQAKSAFPRLISRTYRLHLAPEFDTGKWGVEMNDWKFLQKDHSEALARLHHFSIVKKLPPARWRPASR